MLVNSYTSKPGKLSTLTTLFTLKSLLLLICSGCSNQALYENIQLDAKLECEESPPQEYDQCIRSHSESYAAFKRARQELLED